MESLLLDSAGPSNIQFGCPESDFAGVPYSCHKASESKDQNALFNQTRWYALRVSYSRALKVQDKLNSLGVKTFVPMMWVNKEINGKRRKELVPAVQNLCFTFWSRNKIREFIDLNGGDTCPAHFYWDRTKHAPMEIPQKAMEDFIRVASEIDKDIVFLPKVADKFREGQKVTILDGPFKGVTGKVVRVRKSRRVLVELPGLLAVATTYIEPSLLKPAESGED